MDTLEDLPLEIWVNLVQFLSIDDWINLSQNSKKINQILHHLTARFDKDGEPLPGTPLFTLVSAFNQELKRLDIKFSDLVENEEFKFSGPLTQKLIQDKSNGFYLKIKRITQFTKIIHNSLKQSIELYVNATNKKLDGIIKDLQDKNNVLIQSNDPSLGYQDIRRLLDKLERQPSGQYYKTFRQCFSNWTKNVLVGGLLLLLISAVFEGPVAIVLWVDRGINDNFSLAQQFEREFGFLGKIMLSIGLAFTFFAILTLLYGSYSGFVEIRQRQSIADAYINFPKECLLPEHKQAYNQIYKTYKQFINAEIAAGQPFATIADVVNLMKVLLQKLPVTKNDLLTEFYALLHEIQNFKAVNDQLKTDIMGKAAQGEKGNFVNEVNTYTAKLKRHVFVEQALTTKIGALNNRYRMWQSKLPASVVIAMEEVSNSEELLPLLNPLSQTAA